MLFLTSNLEPLTSFSYTYDKVGNRLSQVTTSQGHQDTSNYTYDKICQLKTSTRTPEYKFEGFLYDSVGNRTTERQNYQDTEYFTNNLNQYTETKLYLDSSTYLPETFTYDLKGNLTTRSLADSQTTYSYDYENRLTQVTRNQSPVASYKYDFLGRMIQLANSLTGEQVNYIYDGDHIIAEYDSSGNLLKKYIYGPNIVRKRPSLTISLINVKFMVYFLLEGRGCEIISLSP